MLRYKDQIGNSITFSKAPKRIISIVPSQSEFLWDIGLRDELVGITKFCIHPSEMFRSVERVGGTKKLDIAKIRRLKPDLIIGNKEENEKADIELLQKEFNVWMSDIYNFKDAFKMMSEIGKLVDKEKEASKIVLKLKRELPKTKNSFEKLKVAYFIWNKPYMFAAKKTFINYVLNYIGFKNALNNYERYPQLNDADLQRLNPDLCFLSSEPFPFNEKHIKELQKKLPDSKVIIVDGEVFSWYGSRLLHLTSYIKDLKKTIKCLVLY